MTIKQQGGIFGRNPSFNDVEVNDLTVSGSLGFSGTLEADNGLEVDGAFSVQGTSGKLNQSSAGNVLQIAQGMNTEAAVVQVGTGRSGDGFAYIDLFGTSGATFGTRLIRNGGTNGATLLQAKGTGGLTIRTDDAAPVVIQTGGAEAARFNTSGNLAFPSGQGIDFSATSGTGTSELFDDYEEGTWTPEVADAQTGGNTAAGTFTGYYTKIGRMVNLMCILDNIDTTGMTGGNALYVRNLPYAPASLIGAQRALSNVMMLNVAFDTSAIVTAEIPDNFTYARIAECSSGGSRVFITVGDLTSGTADINLQFNYYT